MQEWQGINEFVSVVEKGSFTQAAKHLGVSTAHISRSVNALEQRLAVKLLNRSTRQVSNTPSGLLYYQQCRQLLDGLADANRSISQLNKIPRGLVKITAPIYYGERVVVPVISQIMQQYPDIEVDVQLSDHTLDLISGGFDLAIRLGSLPDSSLMARGIGSRHYHVVASTEYVSRYGLPQSIDELRDHNCLRGISDHWRFCVNKQLKEYRVSGNWRCNSGAAVLQAAMDGLGIAQLPDYYVDLPVSEGKLIRVLENHAPANEGIWAVYPPNRHLSTKLRVIIDFLAAELSDI